MSNTDLQDFTWIPFYKKFATKLNELNVEGRKNLASRIAKICKKNEGGKEVTIIPFDATNFEAGIDPFTVFALFNKNIRRSNRIAFIKAVRTEFEIDSPIPNDFHGIPLCNNINAIFSDKENLENAWNLFRFALEYASGKPLDIQEFRNSFETIIKWKSNGTGKISMGLFWIAPDFYINLDGTMVSFIENWKDSKEEGEVNEVRKILNKEGKISFDDYLKCCQAMRNFITREKKAEDATFIGFAELSHKAYDWASIDSIKSLLLANGQIILHGAPGTGKTYMAEHVAEMIVTEGLSKEEEKKMALSKSVKSVQFHPGYDYSDFIVGMKPMLVSETSGNEVIRKKGQLVELVPKTASSQDDQEFYAKGYEEKTFDGNKVQQSFKWEDGIFKQIADTALEELKKNPANPPKFVLVIDEINRADLSNVFGEVFSCMEQGYRYRYKRDRKNPATVSYEQDDDGKKKTDSNGKLKPIVLKYKPTTLPSKAELIIPENLYIIGTMNDIDRSVETIDFALRRRFGWKEVTADESQEPIIESKGFDCDVQERLYAAMDALNDAIVKSGELKLSRDHELGAAYFANLELYPSTAGRYTKNSYESLWNNHLAPILTEYLRGQDPEGKKLKDLKSIYDEALAAKQA